MNTKKYRNSIGCE